MSVCGCRQHQPLEAEQAAMEAVLKRERDADFAYWLLQRPPRRILPEVPADHESAFMHSGLHNRRILSPVGACQQSRCVGLFAHGSHP